MPVYASAQTPDRITLLENFGNYDRETEPCLFMASVLDDHLVKCKFLTHLCHIHLMPIPHIFPSNGITSVIKAPF